MEVYQHWEAGSVGSQCVGNSFMSLQPWSPSSCSTYSESDSYNMGCSGGQENMDFSHHHFFNQQQTFSPDCSVTSDCSQQSSRTSVRTVKTYKPKCPTKRFKQRNAANQRERKRMRTINDAFDGLRCRIPEAKEDKKMSKVDTLRMAIQYIHQLTDTLQSSCGEEGDSGSPGRQRRGEPKQEKVVIRYHHHHHHPQHAGAGSDATYQPMCSSQTEAGMLPGAPPPGTGLPVAGETEDTSAYPLYGHSLSWKDNSLGQLGPDNKLCAKLWVPQEPSNEDMANMAAV